MSLLASATLICFWFRWINVHIDHYEYPSATSPSLEHPNRRCPCLAHTLTLPTRRAPLPFHPRQRLRNPPK